MCLDLDLDLRLHRFVMVVDFLLHWIFLDLVESCLTLSIGSLSSSKVVEVAFWSSRVPTEHCLP